MSAHNKKILTAITVVSAAAVLVACASFSAGLPSGSVELRHMRGEFQNTYDTQITEARASWMIGESVHGEKYSLIVIGERGSSENQDYRLNYDAALAGVKASGAGKWWVSAVGNGERYRVEAGLKFEIEPRLQGLTSTIHSNTIGGGHKRTQQQIEFCYEITKNLCGIAGYRTGNQGEGADFVEDEFIAGVRYEF